MARSVLAQDGLLYLLRIEVDGHHHGGPPIRPWVAEIGAPCPRYGLQRRFLRPMNDWGAARVAMSGNTYGVVATFPLREGRLYEVQRCEGPSSKRRAVRRFVEIAAGRQRRLDPDEALARIDGGGMGAPLLVRERADAATTSVARVIGLGHVEPLGFIRSDTHRRYRVRDGGVYAVHDAEGRRLIGVRAGTVEPLTPTEAWSWLG